MTRHSNGFAVWHVGFETFVSLPVATPGSCFDTREMMVLSGTPAHVVTVEAVEHCTDHDPPYLVPPGCPECPACVQLNEETETYHKSLGLVAAQMQETVAALETDKRTIWSQLDSCRSDLGDVELQLRDLLAAVRALRTFSMEAGDECGDWAAAELWQILAPFEPRPLRQD